MSASQHPAVAAADVDRWPAAALVADSRTRAQAVKHPVITTAPERVDYVIQLMGEDVWNSHTSRMLKKTLSALWGISESTMSDYSTEAHRAIEREIKENRAPIAGRAVARLEIIASCNPYCEVAGVAGAAVRANEVLLKATGFGEPEEDKQRQGPVLQLQVGQFATSPAMQLVLGPPPPEFVLTTGEAVAESTETPAPQDGATQSSAETDGTAEEAGSVPEKFDWS